MSLAVAWPNPRLQRTRVARFARQRSPLSRKPLGSMKWRSSASGIFLLVASQSLLAAQPVPVGPGITAPQVVSRVDPPYCWDGRHHPEGTVTVKAVISKKGTVRDAHVIKGIDPGCDTAVLAAVRKWKYRPALKDGKPIEVFLDVNITISIH
jgi:TonB family protein